MSKLEDRPFHDLTGYDAGKAALTKDVFFAALSRLRQTRPGLATMLEDSKYFLVCAYEDDYGKLRETRARYSPYATMVDFIEFAHPQAGPVHAIVMQPRHGFTVAQILKIISGKDMPDEMA